MRRTLVCGPRASGKSFMMEYLHTELQRYSQNKIKCCDISRFFNEEQSDYLQMLPTLEQYKMFYNQVITDGFCNFERTTTKDVKHILYFGEIDYFDYTPPFGSFDKVIVLFQSTTDHLRLINYSTKDNSNSSNSKQPKQPTNPSYYFGKRSFATEIDNSRYFYQQLMLHNNDDRVCSMGQDGLYDYLIRFIKNTF